MKTKIWASLHSLQASIVKYFIQRTSNTIIKKSSTAERGLIRFIHTSLYWHRRTLSSFCRCLWPSLSLFKPLKKSEPQQDTELDNFGKIFFLQAFLIKLLRSLASHGQSSQAASESERRHLAKSSKLSSWRMFLLKKMVNSSSISLISVDRAELGNNRARLRQRWDDRSLGGFHAPSRQAAPLTATARSPRGRGHPLPCGMRVLRTLASVFWALWQLLPVFACSLAECLGWWDSPSVKKAVCTSVSFCLNSQLNSNKVTEVPFLWFLNALIYASKPIIVNVPNLLFLLQAICNIKWQLAFISWAQSSISFLSAKGFSLKSDVVISVM